MSDNALGRLFNRIRHVVQPGRILLVDDEGGVQRHQVDLGPAGPARRLWDKGPALGWFGLASNPPTGSDVVCLFIGGDPSNGVVIACGHQQYRIKGLAPGEVSLHDQWGHEVRLTEAGITITHPTKVRVETPTLECTGDIVDRCDGNGVTLKALRDAYNAHKHLGVQTGAGTTAGTDHPAS